MDPRPNYYGGDDEAPVLSKNLDSEPNGMMTTLGPTCDHNRIRLSDSGAGWSLK